METFSELKRFLNSRKENGKTLVNEAGLYIQIYEHKELQCNISSKGFLIDPSLKLEERRPNIFTVAVCPEECMSDPAKIGIKYSKTKKFYLTDKLVEIKAAFPEGYKINEIVDGLLAIKE